MFIIKWLIALARPFVDRFPKVAAIYRGVRDQVSVMAKPTATPWGFKLAGNAAMAAGTFEPLETELVRKLLNDVDVFINVGANVGYYCCHALSMGKAVVAFEPIPRNLRYLCQNIKSNEWRGAEIYPIALSNNVGVLEIYGGDTGASILKGWAGTAESYATLVPSSTLDVVLGNRFQEKKILLVVDVEGAEHWMLEGAATMLSRTPKPIWLVEITAHEHQPAGIGINPQFKSTFQFFFEHGYQAFNVDEQMLPVSAEQVELAAQGLWQFNTHNFLFCEQQIAL